MSHAHHWRQIVRQYVSTLPSGSVFRSRDVFDHVQATIAPTDRQWRQRLSKAIRHELIPATDHPRCQTFFVP